MSGFLKSIGRVFKKVIKTVVKVLPYALAAAAVVFTGGAALGILPSFAAAVGGVTASLGLGATLTGALTGAITSAGFGAAIGGITGGEKGLKMGALTGALTGGLMGAANPATFGIVKGAEGVTTANALRNGGNAFAAAGSKTALTTGADGITSAVSNIAPAEPISALSAPEITPSLSRSMTGGGTGGFGSAASALQPTAGAPVADVARSAITSAATGAAPTGTSAAGGAGGFMGMLNNNPLLAQSLLGGISNIFGGSEADDRYGSEYKYDKKAAEDAYGGVYSGNSNAFGSVGLPPPPNLQRPIAKRWAWNPQTNRTEEVPA